MNATVLPFARQRAPMRWCSQCGSDFGHYVEPAIIQGVRRTDTIIECGRCEAWFELVKTDAGYIAVLVPPGTDINRGRH